MSEWRTSQWCFCTRALFENTGFDSLLWKFHCIVFIWPTGISLRGVSGFVTECPCGVWGCGLTTCLQYASPSASPWSKTPVNCWISHSYLKESCILSGLIVKDFPHSNSKDPGMVWWWWCRDPHQENRKVSLTSYLYNRNPYLWEDGLHIETGSRFLSHKWSALYRSAVYMLNCS